MTEETKSCPFCAETIKAAAIRCRFCGSDLPVPEVAEAPVVAAPPEVPATPVQVEQQQAGGALPGWVKAGAALSTVALLALSALAFVAWRDARELNDSADAAKAVRASVAADVESLLSYDYKTYDEDVSKAQKLLTSAFRKEYAPTVESIRSAAVEQKRTQEADVVAVSVVEATPDRVKTLLFVNTTTFTESDQNQRLLQNRIGVTLTRNDAGKWLIADVTFPQT